MKGSKVDNEGEFVRQVLYGTNRYDKLTQVSKSAFYPVVAAPESPALLQGMLDRMYEKYGLATPADNVMNSIISYIAILRLTELPIKEFRRLVLGQNPVKMRQLLSYIFLEDSESVTACLCIPQRAGVADSLCGRRIWQMPGAFTTVPITWKIP